jgi:nucleoid-associated protein YgaU
MEPSAAPAAGQETAVPAGVSAAATPAPGEESAAVAKPSAEPAVATGAPLVAEAPVAAEPPIPAEAPVTAEPQVAATTAPAVEEPPPPEPKVVVAAVEADTGGALYIAGTATTDGTVRVYIDGAVIGDAVSSPSGTWLIETTRDMPAGSYVVRADQVDDGGNVIARSEVPFEREVEVAILKPTGMTASADGATLTGAVEMETVIIKRGDNLWRIARGAWGKGIRWSTIYQANADQIRNPHWIYPGQVFVMPKGDPAWQN